ncbi:MAG TPA: hypothetical protein PLA69_09150 [Flavobacterium sp.]|nr:hypothetical protein [Flavobacterium sp.]
MFPYLYGSPRERWEQRAVHGGQRDGGGKSVIGDGVKTAGTPKKKHARKDVSFTL